eukprot:CAMPEP_0170193656 /NCGR_PEP_ID=MMETSP0040_2-20121228/57369_1 /TAXON_ID=641309 /ORGANISM="Lotharella oceanica, Strain CCMP622" /LENGTH=299 /DNA_ID=CAMNT_0010442353 /DNA_START=237 /DNA_END=1136 /DNA_ORIENTATION=+
MIMGFNWRYSFSCCCCYLVGQWKMEKDLDMSPTDYWRVVPPGLCLCCCCDRLPPDPTEFLEDDAGDFNDDKLVEGARNRSTLRTQMVPIEDHFHLCFEDSDEEKEEPNFLDDIDLSQEIQPTPFSINVRPPPKEEKNGAGTGTSLPPSDRKSIRPPVDNNRLQSFIASKNRLSIPRQYYMDLLKLSTENISDPQEMRARAETLRRRSVLRLVHVREHKSQSGGSRSSHRSRSRGSHRLSPQSQPRASTAAHSPPKKKLSIVGEEGNNTRAGDGESELGSLEPRHADAFLDQVISTKAVD